MNPDSSFTAPFFNITSTGNVGIGTTVPLSRLHSSGNLTVGPGATAGSPSNVQLTTGGASPINNRLTYGTDGTGWKFAISKNQGGTVTDQVVVQDDGRVGIGTPTPSELLTVFGNIDTNQSASDIGDTSTFINRYVTKDWVMKALAGSIGTGLTIAQRDAITTYLINYLFAGSTPSYGYNVIRDAIAKHTLTLITPASGGCSGNETVQVVNYDGATGAFSYTCKDDNHCAAAGNCASVYAGGSVFATTNYCYGTSGGPGTCMTNGNARINSCAMVVRNVYLTSSSTSGDDWICPSSKVMAGIRLGAIDDISTMTVLCCSITAVNNN
jgi:hypothetical protein